VPGANAERKQEQRRATPIASAEANKGRKIKKNGKRKGRSEKGRKIKSPLE
jgi:hypothetical protein